MKFNPLGARFVTCGQTDRHDEAISSFRNFCERAQLKVRLLGLSEIHHYKTWLLCM
jgi:hypothetical protein